MAGDFTHADGSRYVMCVNKDFNNNTACHPQFREPVKKLEFVSPYSGQLTPYDVAVASLAGASAMITSTVPVPTSSGARGSSMVGFGALPPSSEDDPHATTKRETRPTSERTTSERSSRMHRA